MKEETADYRKFRMKVKIEKSEIRRNARHNKLLGKCCKTHISKIKKKRQFKVTKKEECENKNWLRSVKISPSNTEQ